MHDRLLPYPIREEESGKTVILDVPVSVAYYISFALASTFYPFDDEVIRTTQEHLLTHISQDIPEEILEEGIEGYTEDVAKLDPIRIPICREDMTFISEKILSLPKEKKGSLSSEPRDPEIMALRNKHIRACLGLTHLFVQAGGESDPKMKEALEEELS